MVRAEAGAAKRVNVAKNNLVTTTNKSCRALDRDTLPEQTDAMVRSRFPFLLKRTHGEWGARGGQSLVDLVA